LIRRTRERPALRNNIGRLVIASKRGSFLEVELVLLPRSMCVQAERQVAAKEIMLLFEFEGCVSLG
jgi:hypothetical protein